MSKKRVMAKAKVYGFSPWVDQLNAINQIMEDTGEKAETKFARRFMTADMVGRLVRHLSKSL